MKNIINFLMGDKMTHFLYSFLFVVTVFSIAKNLLAAVIITIVIGFSKEAYDYKYGTGFNSYDILADVCGIFYAVVLLSYMINY